MMEYDVLIGTLGSSIDENCWSDPSTNKIGGFPDWLNGNYKVACTNCGRVLTLVCQLSCPIDKKFKRTLYLLTCINIKCAKKNEWVILRGMCLKNNFIEEKKLSIDELDDDWGMSNIEEFHEPLPNYESVLNTLSFDTNLHLENKEEIEEQLWNNMMKKHNLNNSLTKNNIFLPHNAKIAFKSYYIESSFEEEYQCITSDKIHYNEDAIISLSMPSTLPENYEKCVPPHKDIQFHKFYERIQICPQQCLRYYRGGKPLIVQDITFSIPSCDCGSPRIFECQLMPQILTYLLLDGPSSALHPLDFFSILIYTCSSNCWDNDRDTYKAEYAIVLPSV